MTIESWPLKLRIIDRELMSHKQIVSSSPAVARIEEDGEKQHTLIGHFDGCSN